MDAKQTGPSEPGTSLALARSPSISGAFADLRSAPAAMTNIGADEPDRDRLLMKTLGEPDFSADDLFGSVFLLSRYIAMGASWEGESESDSRDGVRTVLIDVDGQTASFGSDGIVRALDMLIACRGPGPWNPPIPVRLKQYSTARGRRRYTLEIVALPDGQR